MWTARETALSECEHSNKYNYFPEVHYFGYIGCTNTMQELIDYIRNPEDSYKKLHLKEASESDGSKYYLTIRSLTYGYKVEFELFNLDDLDGCDDIYKDELMEVKVTLSEKMGKDRMRNYTKDVINSLAVNNKEDSDYTRGYRAALADLLKKI